MWFYSLRILLSPQYRKCNGLLNITEIVSAKQDKEVSVEIQSYSDRKHLNETMVNMEKHTLRTISISYYSPDLALLLENSVSLKSDFIDYSNK
jgi:hypothetical protein